MVKTNAIFRLKTAQKHKALYGCEAQTIGKREDQKLSKCGVIKNKQDR